MTLFDLIVLGILLVSAAAGVVRGAVREMVTVIAFVLAAVAAVYGLRFSGPIARKAIDPDWAGNVAAVMVVFVVVYILLRLAGGALSRGVKRAPALGVLDRSVGFGFGLIRALILLGAFNLAFHAATPPERVPRWISGAALYPLTETAGKVLKAFAPKGLDMAGRLKPAIAHAVRDGSDDTGPRRGYDARQRGEIDELVEKSR